MSDQAAFQEVDDAVRQDDLKLWWKRWGTWVVAGAVLAVVAVAGLVGWRQYDASRRAEASAAYSTALAQLAQDKGYSVVAFNGMATREWWDAIRDEPALVHGLVKTARLTVFGGGVAITEGETVVGAVGVSGGSAEQDHEIAEAGAAAVG